jgi:hypothetical protein
MSNNKYTLYGKAKFSYLTQPDTGFGKEEYSVTLELSKDKAQEHIKIANQIISKVIAEEHKAHPSTKQLTRAPFPFKDDGEMVTVKIHSKFKPTIWDKNAKKLSPDVQVWKDSTMWVNYEPRGYNKSIGIGCTLYMSGVQIDTLVEGSALNGECPFPKREEELGDILSA